MRKSPKFSPEVQERAVRIPAAKPTQARDPCLPFSLKSGLPKCTSVGQTADVRSEPINCVNGCP
jgi:hypothetical protein